MLEYWPANSDSDSGSDYISNSPAESLDSGDNESVISEDLDLYHPRYVCQFPINLKG